MATDAGAAMHAALLAYLRDREAVEALMLARIAALERRLGAPPQDVEPEVLAALRAVPPTAPVPAPSAPAQPRPRAPRSKLASLLASEKKKPRKRAQSESSNGTEESE